MAAEIFMTAVEYRKFQCIDHSTYSINNSSGKKPCKSGRGHIIEDLRKSQNTGPSHTNVEDRGDPFRTKHPECLDQYAGNRKCPYNTKKRDATSPFYYKEAYRCIASCDQNGDHHMIDFFQDSIYFWRDIKSMIRCTCLLYTSDAADDS